MEKDKQIKANNDAIKKCLRANNCTQTELANAMGVALQSVNKWFLGDMSLTRAQSIAEYLGVTLSELIGERDTAESEIITYHGKQYRITPIN